MRSLVNSIQESARLKEKQFEAQSNVSDVGDMWSEYRGQFESTFESKGKTIIKGGKTFEVLP